MIQKERREPARRGRPRAYEPETALQRAFEAFWNAGYTGTSLDEIAAATGMNRPSLYAAFGDKHALYLKALEHYWQRSFFAMQALKDAGLALDEALMQAYDAQLSIYFSGDGEPRGCFAIGTATAEAVEHPEIRSSLVEGLRTLDAELEARLRRAHVAGELKGNADPAALAAIASATLHSLAIRARAGVPRAELREFARKAVSVICG